MVVGRLIDHTKARFPSLKIPPKVSLRDRVILQPQRVAALDPVDPDKCPLQLATTSRFREMPYAASASHVLTSRELNYQIPTAYQRVPFLHSTYEHVR